MNKIWSSYVVRDIRCLLTAAVLGIASAHSGRATEVDRWMNLAEASAQQISEEEGQYQVWRRIAELYARRRMADKARLAIERISHEAVRSGAMVSLAGTFAQLGHTDDATHLAFSSSTAAERDGALMEIALTCLTRHEFSLSRKLILKIGDFGVRGEAWPQLVTAQASAGKYEDAIATLNEFPWNRYGMGASDKADLLAFITKAKETGKRKPPADDEETIYQRIRGLGGSWEKPTAENLPTYQKRAGWVDVAPKTGVPALFLLARWHANHDKPMTARKHLTKAVQFVRNIEAPYDRGWYCSLICGLALELGEPKQAAALRQDVLTDEAIRKALQADDHARVAPKAVSVLVQLGDMKAAFLVASTAQGATRYDAWWAIGASSAMEGRVKEVETRLRKLDGNIEKALVCTGVAAGLHELQSSGALD